MLVLLKSDLFLAKLFRCFSKIQFVLKMLAEIKKS